MDARNTMLVFLYIYLQLLSSICLSQSTQEMTTENVKVNADNSAPSVTQTVYGFLDFTTTIGNTVMVFSPQSAATTSEKPTSPVTIINEKPREAEGTAVEITPSKPASFFTYFENSETSQAQTTSDSQPTIDDKSSTKSLPKSSTLSSPSSTSSKTKSGKATPKSLAVSTTSSKLTPKDKPKTLPKSTQTTEKSEGITSSVNNGTQLAATKKLTEKATKPPTKPKVDKVSKPQIIHPQAHDNAKSKITAKEKPKSTDKTTSTKISTSEFTAPTPREAEDVNTQSSSIVIASKVEVREGPTNIHKLKKQDIEPTSVKNEASASTVEAKSSIEDMKSSAAEDAGTSKSTEIKKEEKNSLNSAEEPAIISSSGVIGPEYDYLSRQPSEVIDETFRVIDLKPNSGKHTKQKTTYRGPTSSVFEETQPLGLITSLYDSVIRDGLTTIYETNIVGTVISGKYAQVLQSNSHVQSNQRKIKPTTATAARILKTVAPTSPKPSRIPNLEPTPTYEEDASSVPLEILYNADQSIKPSRRPSLASSNSFSKNKYTSNKNKFKEDYREDYGTTSAEEEDGLDTDYTLPTSNPTPPSFQQSTSSKKTSIKKSNQNGRPFKYQNSRHSKPTTPELATVSVFSESQSSVTPSYSTGGRGRFQPSSRRTKPTTSTESGKSYSGNKHSYKTKIGPSHVENNNINPVASSSTYKFKLSRPSGRWQYKTSPKPRVTIRRQDEALDNVTVSPVPQFTPDIQLEGSDQELSGSGIYPALQHEDNSIIHDITPSLTAETLRVEISTPADFKDVYYEIATIKTPYSFQVGTVKNTRFITVTSTFEKNLVQPTESPISAKNEPLSENILVSTHNAYDKEPPLDSSIATLPPIGLAGDAETPPLETMTESFSTTQLMLKTHILPVIRGGSDTTRYTLVQSYHVTRLVTATKTLPPMEVYQFVPSKTLNEFNTRLDEAGSEVHLELEFGDNNEQDEEGRPNVSKALLSDLDLTNIGSDFDIADVDKNKILEQHLRSKKAHKLLTTTSVPTTPETPTTTTPALSPDQLQQLAILRLLNPNGALPNLLTSSKPVIKVETAYETHILPIFNGASTYFTTISRPTATLTKTEFEYVTNTLPIVQPSVFNPLFPQPSFQIATTPIVTQTMVTETDSKVLKLTFGAKTSYTTLFSTKVTPTILTTYLTHSIPIQATASFPGFFNPAPYGFNAPFPFVG